MTAKSLSFPPPSGWAKIQSRAERWVGLVLVIVSALEIASACWGHAITVWAAWTWVALALLSLLLTVASGLWHFHRWVLRGEIMILVTVGICALACFEGISGYDRVPINYESAQQVSAGISAWTKVDLDYHGSAFLGYSARQYLLISLPSVLAGPSLFALRLGFALLFFGSFLHFLAGLYDFWTSRDLDQTQRSVASPFVALSGLVVIGFPVVILWLKAYEQTIIPISLCLLAAGCLLQWLADPKPVSLLPLAWCAGMLSTSYTPALSVWGLALATFTFLIWKSLDFSKSQRSALAAVGCYTLVIGVVSLIFLASTLSSRLSVNSAGFQHSFTTFEWTERLKAGFSALFFHRIQPYITPLLVFPFCWPFLQMLSRLPTSRHLPELAVWLWAFASIIAALSMRGYVQRAADFDLHRSIVIIPPLVFLVAGYWRALLQRSQETWRNSLYAFSAVLAFMTLHQLQVTRDVVSLQPYAPGPEEFFAMKLQMLAKELPLGAKINVVAGAHAPILNGVDAALHYFAPGEELRRVEPNLTTLLSAKEPFIAIFSQDAALDHDLAQKHIEVSELPLPAQRLSQERFVVVTWPGR